jgi:H3 lysine-79-specific histone-lysine N-methyltransferase
MEKLAKMAREQRTQMTIRARMSGAHIGIGDVELEHANMLESARVNELMTRADVVLVNNKGDWQSWTVAPLTTACRFGRGWWRV